MKQQIRRRLERLESRHQHMSIVEIARKVGPEAGIEVEELVAGAEAMLAECQRYGLMTLEAMIDYFAAKDGISPEVLRREMDALGAMR